MKKKLNVLIVDDSVIYRKTLTDIFHQIEECDVVKSSPNAELALRRLENEDFNIVFTDINMPGINGFELQKKIKQLNPDIQVFLMSSENYSQATLTIEALNNGAIDFIQKPLGQSHDRNLSILQEDIFKVIKVLYPDIKFKAGTAQPSTPQRERSVAPPKPANLKRNTIPQFSNYKLLAIGVSTGGPQALASIIPSLPANFPIPIVIIQHMPANFTKSLAESLDRKSSIAVSEAVHAENLQSGHAYIAPGGKQMKIVSGGTWGSIQITDAPPENSCKPAVDYTFRSIAENFPNVNILSVILTGMGSDGCVGIELLKNNKCFCITQSARSCVVYGMPKAVDDAGLSDLSIDKDSIAQKLTEMVH